MRLLAVVMSGGSWAPVGSLSLRGHAACKGPCHERVFFGVHPGSRQGALNVRGGDDEVVSASGLRRASEERIDLGLFFSAGDGSIWMGGAGACRRV